MKTKTKAEAGPTVDSNLINEVLRLVADCTATEPQLPQVARKRLQDKVKAALSLAKAERGQQ